MAMTAAMVPDLLDWAHAELRRSPDRVPVVLPRLGQILTLVRSAAGVAQWPGLVAQCRRHPVFALLLEDPLTRWSFTKPRGYPGDATLHDMIHAGHWRTTPASAPSELGAAIFRHTIESQFAAAVRQRRQFLAARIDAVAARTPGAAILSVGCGHLRELELSRAIGTPAIARCVGLDQDEKSIAWVNARWRGVVETIPRGLRALWSPPLCGADFDFVYAAGFYDYLDEEFAQHVTQQLCALLRPGGCLLVANHHPSIRDAGYMEAFMDWRMIHRDHAAMERLGARVPRGVGTRIHADATEANLYLEIERPA